MLDSSIVISIQCAQLEIEPENPHLVKSVKLYVASHEMAGA